MDRPEKPTLKNAVLAKCHNCMCYYGDGVRDCCNTKCSLYTWMPRRKLEPNLEWMNYNPRRPGKVKWEDCGQNLTDEQRKARVEHLKKYRESKND